MDFHHNYVFFIELLTRTRMQYGVICNIGFMFESQSKFEFLFQLQQWDKFYISQLSVGLRRCFCKSHKIKRLIKESLLVTKEK